MYRGMLRSEHVQVWRRVVIDDGCGGEMSRFPAVTIERYFATIWRNPTEHVRTDQGNMEITPWGIMGDNADIQEGDKIVRHTGQEFVITRVWQDRGARRRKPHLEGVMHLYQP